MTKHSPYIISLSELHAEDAGQVGGKNASLGELINSLSGYGVAVPGGFAITVPAFRFFLKESGIEAIVRSCLERLRLREIDAAEVARILREAIMTSELPLALRDAISDAYCALDAEDVAVRSSATGEDSAEASYAGQHETYLNVRGEEAVIAACKRCFASLFAERAIAYRLEKGIPLDGAAMSVGVQRMVRSDRGCAGVMFTLDPESGFPNAIVINGAWGLGEGVVGGIVDPDEFTLFKPLLDKDPLQPIVGKQLGPKLAKFVYGENGQAVELVKTSGPERRRFVLSDEEAVQLARWGVAIESHYGRPMDIEWAKDGISGDIFIVQARPETVQAHARSGAFKTYTLKKKGKELLSGHAIGDGVASGKVCRLDSPKEADRFVDGAVLVAAMTDPDWVPLMRRASAIVTDHGGRTSHAAIVSRELGLPAITGSERATKILKDGDEVTVCCAEGEIGRVYAGKAEVQVDTVDLNRLPSTHTKVMLNIGDPAEAWRWWRLPADGVGLARTEFIISNSIKCHPLALAQFENVTDSSTRRKIEAVSAGYRDKAQFFVSTLARGIARIAATVHPKPAIVRMSDFKSNEYADLIGGAAFEPKEENPMLGWRGASRYYHEAYKAGFALECQAIRFARETIGMRNIIIMIPFCRTPAEADMVFRAMHENGLFEGKDALQVFMMCEVPSNVILLEKFSARFDGFSIGSNDLTQLLLGVDRDSARLTSLFDERNEAVQAVIGDVIRRAHSCGRKIGLCGQAPSDFPEFARMLVKNGIDSMSVTPDSFLKVKTEVAAAERLTPRRHDTGSDLAEIAEAALQKVLPTEYGLGAAE